MGRPSLNDARVGSTQGRYLPLGNFAVEIKRVKVIENHTKDQFFIVEFVVLESDTTEVKIGDVYSFTKPFEDKWGHGPAEIKGWIVQVMDHLYKVDAANNWQDTYTDHLAAAGDTDNAHPQPAKGLRMHVYTWPKPRKDPAEQRTKGSITKHDWRVMEPNEVMGLRASAPVQAAAPVQAPIMPAGAPVLPSFNPQQTTQPTAPATQQLPFTPPQNTAQGKPKPAFWDDAKHGPWTG